MRSASLLLIITLASACPTPPPKADLTPQRIICPQEIPAPPAIPHQRPAHLLASFWIDRAFESGRRLLDAQTLASYNQRVIHLAPANKVVARVDLLKSALRFPRQRLLADLAHLDETIARGQRIFANGRAPRSLVKRLREELRAARDVDELRVALRPTPLRCYADDRGIFDSPRDLAFDLAQCATLHFGEAVRVLARDQSHWFVQAAYGSGWIRPDALSPPLSRAQAEAYLHPKREVVVVANRVGLWSPPPEDTLLGVARLGLHLPLASRPPEDTPGAEIRVQIVGPAGPHEALIRTPDAITFGATPFTRAALFSRAFTLLDTPYGWGGMGDHRDCSRMLMDLFASFGVLLPRNSRQQSEAGTEQIDVTTLNERAKIAAIERAARRGVVLLYLPGHIMLYLGRDGDHLFAFHQFSGYLTPCPGGGETMRRVNRATVTSLDLGRGSSRRAFIERITRIILFAPATTTTRDPKRTPR